MLMRSNKDETAVYGCHCRGVIWLCACVGYWSYCGVVLVNDPYPGTVHTNASVNSTCAQPHPPGYCGEFARLDSPGGGAFANFALPGGRAFANPRGHSRAFDTHAVSYQNITTQKVLQETKQIGSSVKDMNKL